MSSVTMFPKDSSLLQQKLFSSDSVKRLSDSDFIKGTIKLTYHECILVLFYLPGEQAKDVFNVFSLTSRKVVGPIFASVNVALEPELSSTIKEINNNPESKDYWITRLEYPFIIVYREGEPVKVYNGLLNVESLIDYSLKLACCN